MQLANIIDPLEFAGFIRGLVFEYNGPNSLERFLPRVNRVMTEAEFVRGARLTPEIGRYRTWDTEAGISSRPGFNKVRIAVPPISEKMILSEEDRLMLQVGRFFQGTGLPQEIIDTIFDDAANLSRRIQARVELARGEVLTTGTVSFKTTETGMVGTIDYNDSGTVSDTVRKIQTATASPLWSNTAAATPLADMRAWIELYRGVNGNEEPAQILTSRRVVNALALVDEMRYALLPVGAQSPSAVNPAAVQTYLGTWGIPPFQQYEATVRVGGTSTRVIADNLLIMLPRTDVDGFGETVDGVTTEGLDLAKAVQQPVQVASGLVGVSLKTFDPNHIWTKVAGLQFPVLKDPGRILVATVL